MSGEHYFLLEPERSGCRLVHGETFTGMSAGFVPAALFREIERGYDAMNAALKRTAERG
ncbi:MAG: hypothetical protein FJ096_19680 [Deltaproteobacteria bacterium]|nr:hypothetical protein [Deltaproteobacteria bacterium]